MRAGWKGLFAIEKDSFAFDTLKTNLIDGDRFQYDWPAWLERKPWTIEALMEAHGLELNGLRGKVDLLAGGPPCQGFSSAGRRKPGDPRNELVKRYLEFVEAVLPRMVLIENVRGITYDFVDDDDDAVRHNFADEVISKLSVRYHVYTDTLRCSSFGIPQQRPRFFLVGMLKADYKRLPANDKPLKDTAKGADDGFKLSTFNCKVETCHSAATFRDAFAKRRCVVPASAWYEWTGDKGSKTKHRFARTDGSAIWFAGLWDCCTTPDAGEVQSFTILTGPAAGWLSDYHSRAPVILEPGEWAAWLDPSQDAAALFEAVRPERFELGAPASAEI